MSSGKCKLHSNETPLHTCKNGWKSQTLRTLTAGEGVDSRTSDLSQSCTGSKANFGGPASSTAQGSLHGRGVGKRPSVNTAPLRRSHSGHCMSLTLGYISWSCPLVILFGRRVPVSVSQSRLSGWVTFYGRLPSWRNHRVLPVVRLLCLGWRPTWKRSKLQEYAQRTENRCPPKGLTCIFTANQKNMHQPMNG